VAQLRRASSLPLVTSLIVASCASPLPGGAGSATPSAPNGPASAPPSSATFATASTAVAAAAIAYDPIKTEVAPPLSLTGTDGSGLALTRLDARAVVEGPLAFTELHLWFDNPEARIREGRFAITLPPGAALSRFAMEGDDGRWMEAEVVEKMMARRAYEDFLHRRQDPALLEKAAGNEFSARVFPIPAKGKKHLVVSYSQELPASTASYVLPLRGLPGIARVDASVRVARADRANLVWDETTLAQTSWKPDRDFVVPVTAPLAAITSGDWVATRVTVPAAAAGTADDAPASLTILVDTSASRALGFARQVDQVGELIAALARRHAGLEIAVAAFDQDVLPIYRGPASAWTEDHEKALLARQPLGASSFAAGLAWAADAGMKRVILVGDGVVTAGAEGDALIAAIKALGGKGVERFDAVLSGGIRDVDAARTWVSAGLARDGLVIDLDAGAGEAARRLGLAVRSDLAITVKGASWSWPERAVGVQPGDELVVYARGKAVHKASVTIGGQAGAIAATRSNGPLLARAAAQAEIARMERDLARATDAKAKAALRDAIVKRSVASRVMSSLTSFLVLETEADYVRYGIPRNALADILVVGPNGLTLEHRAGPVLIVEPQVAQRPRTKDKAAGKSAAADDARLLVDLAEPEKALAGKDDEDADGASLGRLVDDPPPEPSRVAAPAEAPALPPAPPRVAAGSAAGSTRPAPAEAPRPEPAAEEDSEDELPGARAVRRGDHGRVQQELRRASESRPEPDDDREREYDEKKKQAPPALTGRLATVMAKIAAKQTDGALLEALAWRREQPGDVLALVALGEALEASGDAGLAARAYGSLIDLFPGRADLRRFAGERLERLAAAGRELAIDTYRHAVEDRPDHLTGHRLYAMALVRAGRLADAFAALEHGLSQSYPGDRFRGGTRILREDLGLVAAAWIAKEPGKKLDLAKRLAAHDATLPRGSSLRFVLYWETDANDVDFHIRDGKNGHAYYSSKQLPSGGELYEDITTGYGPECFTIEGEPRAYPYALEIHYYSRGPMGYGMGVLEIMRHDGKGNLSFEHRPYIAMNDHAYVDLGTITGKPGAQIAN
jgi:hypothetical protein